MTRSPIAPEPLAPQPVAPGSAAARHSDVPLREQVYLRLRDEVLSGRRTVTEQLTEPKLAKQLGVSRTPVREALARLVADGLVRREDYGYSVVVPTLGQIRDLYEVRIAVELRGITRAIENASVVHNRALLGTELEHWYELRAHPPAGEAERATRALSARHTALAAQLSHT